MDKGALAILMVFGCPTLVVIAALLFRYRSLQMRHGERLTAMEKGIDLATLSLSDAFQIQTYRVYLLRGLIWLLTGLAIGLCLLVLTPPLFDGPRSVGLFGLIPVGVGLAYLIFYRVEDRRMQTEGAGRGDLSLHPR